MSYPTHTYMTVFCLSLCDQKKGHCPIPPCGDFSKYFSLWYFSENQSYCFYTIFQTNLGISYILATNLFHQVDKKLLFWNTGKLIFSQDKFAIYFGTWAPPFFSPRIWWPISIPLGSLFILTIWCRVRREGCSRLFATVESYREENLMRRLTALERREERGEGGVGQIHIS